MAELSETWEEKKQKTADIQKVRNEALQEMGIALNEEGATLGVFTPQQSPHLLNLSEDVLMEELLLYYLHAGVTRYKNALFQVCSSGVVLEGPMRPRKSTSALVVTTSCQSTVCS